MSTMESVARRERIRELLTEELTEEGVLEPGDRLTYWITLVGTHTVDDDGDELGPVYKVLSVPSPTASQVMGLLEWQRMWMQARITASVLAADTEDDG